MNWLNLQTTVLHAPEYIGADPVARATWLNLLLHCAAQENGGRLTGAGGWPDRRWQQTCGVTLEEVRAAAPLVAIEGDDVAVWGYPSDMEQTVRARRAAARRNGLHGGRPSELKSDGKPMTEPSSVPLVLSSESVKKGKVKKGKRKEEALPRWTAPTLIEWLAYATSLNWPAIDATAAYDHYLACGWRIGNKPVRDWQAAARNCQRRGKTTPTNGHHRLSFQGGNSRTFAQTGAGTRAFS